jgi:SsrA-binding protein
MDAVLALEKEGCQAARGVLYERMMDHKDKTSATICANRRARYDYELLDTFEGGLVLMGSEVKSLREGNAHITEAYASFLGDELFLLGAHIAQYKNAGIANHEEQRTRKILMHRQELKKLKQAREAKGLTLVPLKLYWKSGKAKISLALARGKKNIDKRQTIKSRDWDRQKHRLLKG